MCCRINRSGDDRVEARGRQLVLANFVDWLYGVRQ